MLMNIRPYTNLITEFILRVGTVMPVFSQMPLVAGKLFIMTGYVLRVQRLFICIKTVVKCDV
jgi:hypothetical protein